MVSPNSSAVANNRPRNFFLYFGIFLLFLALTIPVFTFLPALKTEVNYQLTKNNRLPQELIPVDSEFSLIIPKINANTKVIANVDPFDSRVYQTALSRGVAHARGTATPDISGNTFIFAHSALDWYQAGRYNAVFYLLNKLLPGDEIIVYYQQQKYTYRVVKSEIVSPKNISYLSSQPGKNQLTLMTCWPPGTTISRLLVVADKIK